MTAGESCEYLEWDSDFFGVRVAYVQSHRLTAGQMAEVLEWGRKERIDCLYFLSDSDDAGSVLCAEREGFHLVDLRVTLRQSLVGAKRGQLSLNSAVRRGRAEDIPYLRAIAEISHQETRFYYDPRFPAEAPARLYATWIERSCQGYADCVWVTEFEGHPAGYASCNLNHKLEGTIGLAAVVPEARGKGLGRRLVEASLAYLEQNGMESVAVVTQGRNRGALRLYQGCGFQVDTVQLWYHKWF